VWSGRLPASKRGNRLTVARDDLERVAGRASRSDLAAWLDQGEGQRAGGGQAGARGCVLPRPDWYFLFLFQFLKMGPELLMSLVIPPIVVLVLLAWPFIDGGLGTRLGRMLGWISWPVPGRNVITGTGWVLFLGFIVLLTFWSLSGVTIFGVSGG